MARRLLLLELPSIVAIACSFQAPAANNRMSKIIARNWSPCTLLISTRSVISFTSRLKAPKLAMYLKAPKLAMYSGQAEDFPQLSWSEDRVFQWVNSVAWLTEEEKKALKQEGLTGADLPEMTVSDWTDLGISRSKARKIIKSIPRKTFAKQVWINFGTKDEPNLIQSALVGDGDLNQLIQRSGAVGLSSKGVLITAFEDLEDGAQYDLVVAQATRFNKAIEQDEMKKAIRSRAEYLLPRLIKKATGVSIVYKASEMSFELDGKTAGIIDSLFVTDGQPTAHVVMVRKCYAKSNVIGTLENYKKYVGQSVRIISVLFAEGIPEAVIEEALEKSYFVLTEAMELRLPTRGDV